MWSVEIARLGQTLLVSVWPLSYPAECAHTSGGIFRLCASIQGPVWRSLVQAPGVW